MALGLIPQRLILIQILGQMLLQNLILRLHLVMDGVGRRGNWQRRENDNMGRKGGLEKRRNEEIIAVEDQRKILEGLPQCFVNIFLLT